MSVRGLLLAAGAGRRMGRPKALVSDPSVGSWLIHAVQVLLDGGCEGATVVLGAGGDEAERLLVSSHGFADRLEVVRAADWDSGMSASLRAGLSACGGLHDDVDGLLVHLVDLPDVTHEVVRRLVERGHGGRESLARAVYAGAHGHPVLLGRSHWEGAAASALGDSGAKGYLARHTVVDVEMGHLATGRDVDTPPPRPDGPLNGVSEAGVTG